MTLQLENKKMNRSSIRETPQRLDRRQFLKVSAASAAAVAGCLDLAGDDWTEIKNWHDLNAVRDDPSDDYVLADDLDDGTAGYGEHVKRPRGWDPIGDCTTRADLSVEFTGTFDGQGHEITDLQIHRPETDHVGLFSANGGAFGTNVGTIKRVTVREADITGAAGVGALVGRNNGGEVMRSGVCDADITGVTGVGALAGVNMWGMIMRSSVREATVAGERLVGGLAGGNNGPAAKSAVHKTTVNGDSQIGGLVGHNQLSAVSESYVQTAVIAGERRIGGLVGRQAFSPGGEGGTVVESAVREATVAGERLVGGLVGLNDQYTELVESWAAGEVRGNERIGGLVGSQNAAGTVTAGYWDTELAGQMQGIGAGSGDVTGLTTTKLHGETAAEQMDALDFETTWVTQSDPDSYPVLRWMTDTEQETDAA